MGDGTTCRLNDQDDTRDFSKASRQSLSQCIYSIPGQLAHLANITLTKSVQYSPNFTTGSERTSHLGKQILIRPSTESISTADGQRYNLAHLRPTQLSKVVLVLAKLFGRRLGERPSRQATLKRGAHLNFTRGCRSKVQFGKSPLELFSSFGVGVAKHCVRRLGERTIWTANPKL